MKVPITFNYRRPKPESVVMGPNGLKWATFNVGADVPEEYGDYFAWGETKPKEKYSWGTYKWMAEGQSSSEYITKYTFDDKQTNASWYDANGEFQGDGIKDLGDEKLGKERYADDAARANWGGKWRMPTKAEWDWLVNNCTWTWDALNGVAGMLVKAENGNSIFLPASGNQNGTSHFFAGSVGNYWTSSLLTSDVSWYAGYVLFDSGGEISSGGSRYTGRSIRPVCD